MPLIQKFPDDKRHPGYHFYKNTFGGDVFKEISKTHPHLILIDLFAYDINGLVIENAVAIYISSFEEVYELMDEYYKRSINEICSSY
jgi:hypothetical protein